MRQCHSQQLSITATKLANFLESVEAQEVLLQQRLTDAESRRLPPRGSGAQVGRPAILENTAVTTTAGTTVSIANIKTHLYGEM